MRGWKIQNTIGSRQWQSCLLIHGSDSMVPVKFLLTHTICNNGKIVVRSLIRKLLVDFEGSRFLQLGYFLFYRPFKGAFLSLCSSQWVSASVNERCPFTGG